MTWRDEAACLPHDTRLWFDPSHKKDALAICARCEVTEPCLSDAMRYPAASDPIGIRGGLTAEERRTLRRQQQEAS